MEENERREGVLKQHFALYAKKPSMKDCFVTVFIFMICTIIGLLFQKLHFTDTNIVTIYILGVLITSILTDGYLCSIAGSFLSVVLFCFFLKIFRASMLCPPAIQLAQADHGTCVILIYPAGFVKRVIGRAIVAAPSALMHTQRKIPPLWLTPGRWYSLGAKISPGTAGWTGSGRRCRAAGRRWSCPCSPGAWPARSPPRRQRRRRYRPARPRCGRQACRWQRRPRW